MAETISYQKNEFCHHINCEELPRRLRHQPNGCINCKAYQFHEYLQNSNYTIEKNIDNRVFASGSRPF